LKNPLISFLTVNYRQPEVTLALFASLEQLSYTNWELIVVNNDKEPSTLLSEAFKDKTAVVYLESGANLGFAGGNNVGLPHCKGEYVYFVNNDTEVEPQLVEHSLEAVKEYPKLGMMSPKILFYHSDSLLQYAGATPMSSITIRNAGIGSGEKDQGQYNRMYETAYIHGAAMLVPRKVIEEVGPMYADFFLYYEELDWTERIAKAGYSIVYNGLATVYHKESVSTGVDSPLKVYYLTRNRLLFARRNYSWNRLILAWIYFSLVAVPKNILSWLIKGRPDLAKAFLKGYIWNFSNR
jgi:GT2 family glycosyltransferase